MKKTAIKLLITIAVFYLISLKIDFSQAFGKIGSADIFFVLLAFVFQFFSTLIASYRWGLVMRSLAFVRGFAFFFGSYFKGSFFSQALPGSVGGDAIRMFNLKNAGYPLKDSFHGIFIDRIAGLAGLLLINLAANIFSPNLLPDSLFWLINLICAGSLAGLVLLVYLHKATRLWSFSFLKPFLELSVKFFAVYAGAKKCAVQLILSACVHVCSIFCVFMLSNALGGNISLAIFVSLLPPVFLLSIVPISLAGWGVREGAMVGLFALIGADKNLILAVSLFYGIVVLISSLPGAFIWLRQRQSLS